MAAIDTCVGKGVKLCWYEKKEGMPEKKAGAKREVSEGIKGK